ncbi:MAG TPA: hemerythrin domain-containing protein, partial [Syntrophorhabdaceae bacterium]|nr:hemerythrin domain-containing protein [Syntrophorhabdaceae bacterium]
TAPIDPLFVDAVVDFFRVYADRTHHGKEELIMFRDLAQKHMSSDDRRVMDELVAEHVFGRESIESLVEANNHYRRDPDKISEVVGILKTLSDFYPKHIKKEDDVFFPNSRSYLTDEQEQSMLDEFWEFDRRMIHEKYKGVIESYENESRQE